MIPLHLVIPIQDFDAELLPPSARTVGSPAFKKAVTDLFVAQFSPVAQNVTVNISDEFITVEVMPLGQDLDLVETGIDLLKQGRLQAGADMLEAVVAVYSKDRSALYNLGMAKSDLGQFTDAIKYLARFLVLVPRDASALTALGLAYYRSGDLINAFDIMGKAVEADPTNGYAQRNLGGLLAAQGRNAEATPYILEAVRLLPDDVRALYGAAQALQAQEDDASQTQADEYLKRVIALDPNSDIAEEAKRQRSKLAQASMREAVGGGLRPDAMMYILGALEKFQGMTPAEVQAVGFEVAILGQSGLDVNSPDQKYTLEALPGQYSGLHLVSIMYTAFKQIDPSLDAGFDLDREYTAAQQMLGSR